MNMFFLLLALITVTAIGAITAVVFSLIHQRAVTRRIEAKAKLIDFTYDEWVASIERARQKSLELERNEMQSRIDSTFH
jgi:acyl-coenzyme A synthetase/AMP-(fatty) acid ligase